MNYFYEKHFDEKFFLPFFLQMLVRVFHSRASMFTIRPDDSFLATFYQHSTIVRYQNIMDLWC